MRFRRGCGGVVPCLLVAWTLVQPSFSRGADAEDDALSLSGAPEQAVADKPRKPKVFVELTAGASREQNPAGDRGTGRASFDFFHAMPVASGLNAVLSNRVDVVHPSQPGTDTTINSLREAYLDWQRDEGRSVYQLGRVNLRAGSGYGYNPTDFFRDGSLRTITSANPLTLRETRLGSVVLRAQRLWGGGSLAAAYSPKLADSPSAQGANLDLGSTNNRDRGLVTYGSQLSERVNGQLLLGKEAGLPSLQFGANLTALLAQPLVAHVEWSRGSEPDLLHRSLSPLRGPTASRNRAASGLTYTTASKLSLTGEYQYNGFALDRAGWDPVRATGPNGMAGAYLLEALRRQESASRQAYFLYATQEDLGLRKLSLTTLLRINANDHSRLGWVELRYRWDSADLACQLQQHFGASGTEYGSIPYRRSMQLLAAYHFK